ncbi:MAG: hypothetical protein FWJ83_08790, partial [Limnochordales bacterium]
AGIGLARADSRAVVRRGASLTVTDQISIRAANTGDFSVTGQVQAGQGAGLGVAAAVLVAETAAVADLSADAGPGGGSARPDVTVAALDTITRNVVQATSSAPSSSSGTTPGAGTPAAGAQSFITGLLNARSSGADGRKAVTLDPRSGASGGQPGGQPGDQGAALPDIGAAVSVVGSTHRARAFIGENAQTGPLGDVALIARIRDLDQQSAARATATSGPSVNLSGAVVVGLIEHDADAFIGSGARVAAERLGVLAGVERAAGMGTYQWDGLGSVKTRLQAGQDPSTGFLGGYAGASGSGSGGLGITGAVLYLDFDSSASARIDEGAAVTTLGGQGAWQTTLTDAGGQEHAIDWRAAVAVAAETSLTGGFGAGNRSSTGTGQGGIGIGGSYAQVNYNALAEALLGTSASIKPEAGFSAGDVAFTAHTAERQFLVGHGTGGGSDLGLSGNFAFGRFRTQTRAEVAENARLDGGDVLFEAAGERRAFLVAGGFQRPGDDNLSASVALQDVEAATEAAVRGDVSVRNLTVAALADQRLLADVSEMSNSAAVAVGLVNIETSASLARGAGVTVSDTVTVHASAQHDFSFTARSTARDGAAAGIAAALLFADAETEATVATALAGVRNVYVGAEDATKGTVVVGETAVEGQKPVDPGNPDNPDNPDNPENPGSGQPQQSSGTRASGESMVQNLMGDDKLGDKTPAFDADSGAGDGTPDPGASIRLPKIGGAVSTAVTNHRARASIVDGVQITAAGDVAVTARTFQGRLSQRASTGVVSHASQDELPVSISAAAEPGGANVASVSGKG